MDRLRQFLLTKQLSEQLNARIVLIFERENFVDWRRVSWA